MATIGQSITAPESGWRRYDDLDTNVRYFVSKETVGASGSYLGNYTQINSPYIVGSTFYKFNFTGDKIRLYSRTNTTYSDNLTVKIDGIDVGTINIRAANAYQILTFQIEGLSNTEHSIEVINNAAFTANLDAVDIDSTGQLLPFREILAAKNILIKNQNSGALYSVDEKTLIVMPDASKKNIIENGLKVNKEIRLDVDFNKIKYISGSNVVLDNGKKFTIPINREFKTITIDGNY